MPQKVPFYLMKGTFFIAFLLMLKISYIFVQ